jgi:Flp pilus assembly pilin Flp
MIIGAQSQLGASLVEYALLVTFIAVACLLAIAFFGTELSSTYSSAAEGFNP